MDGRTKQFLEVGFEAIANTLAVTDRSDTKLGRREECRIANTLAVNDANWGNWGDVKNANTLAENDTKLGRREECSQM